MNRSSEQINAGPLVSVVVPAFNYGRFIADTLESVRAQSYAAWECVVVDDGSTDDTTDVVARFVSADARFRYVRQENRGLSGARNTGLRVARGRYVQLLDADDLLEPDKLRRQVAFLEAEPDVDLVYGDVWYFDSDRPHERRRSLRPPDRAWMPCVSGRGAALVRALTAGNIMVVNAPLVRRALLARVGPFDEELPVLEDWDVWLRCALAGARFEYRGEPGTAALVRAHETSMTRSDRRFIVSSIAIRRRLASAPDELLDPVAREANARELRWLERVVAAREKIERLVPADRRIVLIDEDLIRPELPTGNAVQFRERGAEYWGPPATGDEAVAELARRGVAGAAEAVVVAWPGMWYLDFYEPLRSYLESRYRCVVRDDDVIV